MGKAREEGNADIYKRYADDIIRQIRENENSSALSSKRWIWELIQNAKDVDNKFKAVSIEIHLYKDKLVFSHNGDCFTSKALKSLVLQVSGKSSTYEDGKTGKYGTGFITTHLLSKVINVEGVVQNPTTHEYDRFNVKLDRSASNSEDMMVVLGNTVDEVYYSLDKEKGLSYPKAADYETRSESDFLTSFTYELKDERAFNCALIGVEDLISTLPITMASLHVIKSVRVCSHISGLDTKYTSSNEIIDSFEDYSMIKTSVLVQKGEEKRNITILTLKNEILALSIEVNDKNQLVAKMADQPVLLRDFPLIGSHEFYFPFFLNGFSFEPTEKRNGLYLNNDTEYSKNNRTIINSAVDASVKFNNWLIENGFKNTYLLASSQIPKPVESWDEEVALPWIKELQKSWRSRLLDQKLVETSEGYVELRNLRLPEFNSSSPKQNEKFFDFAIGMMKEGTLPLKSQLHDWFDVIRHEYGSWDADLKYTKKTFLEELQGCKNIEGLATRLECSQKETFEWLKALVEFIIEANSEKAFEEFAILPDEFGNFHCLKDLKRDTKKPIPVCTKEIYNILLDRQIESTLLHVSLANCDITGMEDFGFNEAIAEINSFIQKKEEYYSGYSRYNYKKIMPSWDKDFNAIMRLANTKTGDASEDEKCAAIRCLITPILPHDTVSDIVPIATSEYWKTANQFILDLLPNYIEWIASTINELGSNLFNEDKDDAFAIDWMNNLFDIRKSEGIGVPEKRCVFPDQNGDFHLFNELHYDKAIPEKFKQLDGIASDRDWKSELLHKGLMGFESHQPMETGDVYYSIKKAFNAESDIKRKRSIAFNAIAILPSSSSSKRSAVQEIYDIAKNLFESTLPEMVETENCNGFDWEIFSSYVLDLTAETIAESETLSKFCEFTGMSEDDAIQYIDHIIDYAETAYGTNNRDKVEELHGVWINQKGDFMPFGEIHIDCDVPNELKDFAISPVIDIDYREMMVDRRCKSIKYLNRDLGITRKQVLNAMDERIYDFAQNSSLEKLQSADFTTLVMNLHVWTEKHIDDLEQMPRYKKEGNSWIVKTISDEKKIAKISKALSNEAAFDAAMQIVEKYGTAENIENLDKENQVLKDEIAKLNEKLSGIIGVGIDNGLSDEKKEEYNREAREAVRERLEKEGYIFTKGIGERSVVDGVIKDKTEYPLVVKSHRSISDLQLNPNEFIELQKRNAMLWMYFPGGNTQAVKINELFKGHDKITISFSSENLINDERLTEFAHLLRFFKDLHFDIKNLRADTVAEKYGDYVFDGSSDRLIDKADENDSLSNL